MEGRAIVQLQVLPYNPLESLQVYRLRNLPLSLPASLRQSPRVILLCLQAQVHQASLQYLHLRCLLVNRRPRLQVSQLLNPPVSRAASPLVPRLCPLLLCRLEAQLHNQAGRRLPFRAHVQLLLPAPFPPVPLPQSLRAHHLGPRRPALQQFQVHRHLSFRQVVPPQSPLHGQQLSRRRQRECQQHCPLVNQPAAHHQDRPLSPVASQPLHLGNPLASHHHSQL